MQNILIGLRGEMMDIQTKRVFDPFGKNDGKRVLVDRIWPRGVSKEQAGADQWLKDAAPSSDLRKWFGHDPSRWDEFKKRYHLELDEKPEVVNQLLCIASQGRLTLLFSARDIRHNQAVALKEYLVGRPNTAPAS